MIPQKKDYSLCEPTNEDDFIERTKKQNEKWNEKFFVPESKPEKKNRVQKKRIETDSSSDSEE